jgi:uncharacterized phiE125 gp8 family phage protein
MPFQLITAPVNEPITLEQAKNHLRIDVPDDDDLINALIQVARQNLEETYELAFITQTWDLYLDSFPGQNLWPWGTSWQLYRGMPIEWRKPPLQSITSVTYYDTAGNPTVWPSTNYIMDKVSQNNPRIGLAYGQSWPAVTLQPINGVVIRGVAGYGADWTTVPVPARQAHLLTIGHYYENREQVLLEQRIREIDLPRGVDSLMSPFNWKRYVA